MEIGQKRFTMVFILVIVALILVTFTARYFYFARQKPIQPTLSNQPPAEMAKDQISATQTARQTVWVRKHLTYCDDWDYDFGYAAQFKDTLQEKIDYTNNFLRQYATGIQIFDFKNKKVKKENCEGCLCLSDQEVNLLIDASQVEKLEKVGFFKIDSYDSPSQESTREDSGINSNGNIIFGEISIYGPDYEFAAAAAAVGSNVNFDQGDFLIIQNECIKKAQNPSCRIIGILLGGRCTIGSSYHAQSLIPEISGNGYLKIEKCGSDSEYGVFQNVDAENIRDALKRKNYQFCAKINNERLKNSCYSYVLNLMKELTVSICLDLAKENEYVGGQCAEKFFPMAKTNEECDKLAELAYFQHRTSKNDIKKCYQTVVNDDKNDTIFDCESLDPKPMVECFKKFFGNDPNICRRGLTKSNKEVCLWEYIKAKGDVNLCELLDNEDDINLCYVKFNYNNVNPFPCEKISDENRKKYVLKENSFLQAIKKNVKMQC